MNTSENTISYSSPQKLAGLDRHESVLLAYSGGADSSAMLDLLANDAQKNGYTLHLAHFNHRIRGEESERDALFCKVQAEKYNLPFHIGSADVPALAKASGNSIEMEAREQRYAFFERVMLDNDIKILATAHHALDQIETVLIHILRGSGISGICGMSECRAMNENGTFLVRPFLHTEREQILLYCKENGISYIEDSTNADTNYMRNAIRAEITPKLREMNQNLSEAFARLAENAREADEFITSEANKFILAECTDGFIPTENLIKCHPAVRAKILTEFCKKSTDVRLERTHIKAIAELCEKQQSENASLSLPEKTRAKLSGGRLTFERTADTDVASEPTEFSIPFAPGVYKMGRDINVTIEKCTKKVSSTPLSITVNAKYINENTVIRTRKAGDCIMINNVHKKVKKLLCDAKIPARLREILPMLAENNEILWIPTLAVCDALNRDTLKSDTETYRITVEL